jgi:FeS assembly SUF system protein
MDISPIEASVIEAQITEALRTVYDPEIPVNIYEMGLIYDIDVEPSGFVTVCMTLTSPGCPAAQSLPVEVDTKVRAVPGVTDAKVDVIWDPPWSLDMMSDEAKLELGML